MCHRSGHSESIDWQTGAPQPSRYTYPTQKQLLNRKKKQAQFSEDTFIRSMHIAYYEEVRTDAIDGSGTGRGRQAVRKKEKKRKMYVTVCVWSVNDSGNSYTVHTHIYICIRFRDEFLLH